MSEHRCSEYVADPISGLLYLCQRRGVLEEQGKQWCRQHAPSNVAARREEARKREIAAVNEKLTFRLHAKACIAACAGVDDPHPGELARLRADIARLRGE